MGSSRSRTSGLSESVSQNAACFLIPLLNLRRGRLRSRSKLLPTASKRARSKPGKTS